MTLEPFSLPLDRPLTTANGTIDRREGFVVAVERRGERGVGEATPLPGWTESRSACEAALERARAVADGDGVDAALDALSPRGTPAARHGLALALADARSRRAGVPLHRHLGGTKRVTAVPVNATVGDGPTDETAAAALAAVEEGFDAIKVKVGARAVEEDVARLRAVREAVGGGVELRADANAAWTREQAREAVEAVAGPDLAVAYVEQPLAADDLAGHAALRGGPVGVALDESLVEHGAATVLDADAADLLVLKPMALGGPDRTRRIACRARSLGVRTVVTTTVDAVYARTAAVHLAASLGDVPACGLATASMLAEDLAPDPCRLEGGALTVPERKGNVPARAGSTGA
ncbi:o-succinylbenzoate synthase [Halomarina pelagica]|uniref:o-succinylbenzoate synthase n=1 Tax=Halomarina pelagica TaxID=2961599 RepID=UPI0020C5A6E9|nr:o-succinylbenzoate synthase [Halomarina sp. BND7]